MKTLLLHHCCVVCTPKILEYFNNLFIVTGFWFNPNIYPQTESNKRLDALKSFSIDFNYNLIVKDDYTYDIWLEEINKNKTINKPDRCKICYTIRLTETAKKAKLLNIDSFSTTLLISPYQYHEIIKEIGDKIGKMMGIKFIYNDFRPEFYNSKNIIYNKKLYMQKYCGCKFSINER